MEYDNDALKSGQATLHVYRVGKFSVFSGRQQFINNPDCTDVPDKGAIPVEPYYIVARPPTSFGGTVRNFGADLLFGTNHDEWFGLFNASTMSDHVFVNGIRRGSFRLHPLRPNGSGESWGCITFFRVTDFHVVSNALLRTKKTLVTSSKNGLMAYGRVDVRGVSDFAKCVY